MIMQNVCFTNILWTLECLQKQIFSQRALVSYIQNKI